MAAREHTRTIWVGGVPIGGGHPIPIQSMTNTKTEDVEATVAQILRLEAAGCDIIRCAVPHMAAAEALREIKKQIHIVQQIVSCTFPKLISCVHWTISLCRM